MRLPAVRRAVCLCWVVLAFAAPAGAFSLFPDNGGTTESALLAAARWADGFGLEDGIQVGVAPGLIESVSANPPTPHEKALFEDGILQSFAVWENSALRFDVTLDAPVVRGPDLGFEIDVIGLPSADPIWSGLGTIVGLADPTFVNAQRTLANGTVANGLVVTGADIYLKVEVMKTIGAALNLPLDEALGSFMRLIIHEVGHTIGLGHPDQSTNYDTDFDPLNPMPIDPADPYGALSVSPFYDATALMVPRPCPGGVIFCEFTTERVLHLDDLAGRDALYPVPEPSILWLCALSVAALAARRSLADR